MNEKGTTDAQAPDFTTGSPHLLNFTREEWMAGRFFWNWQELLSRIVI